MEEKFMKKGKKNHYECKLTEGEILVETENNHQRHH
jgi:hypothetical protein